MAGAKSGAAIAGGGGGGSRPICSICYEDFKPATEDLQTISICGHVFHELCIQQWVEYVPSGKPLTCPMCKQSFKAKNVVRLYFQSSEGGADPTQAFGSSQRAVTDAEADVLREEAWKLERRLSVLNVAFEGQKKRLDELNQEVVVWKEKATKEEEAKKSIQKEKEWANQMLLERKVELSKATAECSRLQERSLALAKELAALKLATDANLEEEEVVKLATVARGNGRDVIDVLKRSLVLRNKSYRELMAQCNLLGRSETRAIKKLEKAEEKIAKLKVRLQELEKVVEEKDNKILRSLKTTNIERAKGLDTKTPCTGKPQTRCQNPVLGAEKSQLFGFPASSSLSQKSLDGHGLHDESVYLVDKRNSADMDVDSCFPFDDNVAELGPNLSKESNLNSKDQITSMFYENMSVQNFRVKKQETLSLNNASRSQPLFIADVCLIQDSDVVKIDGNNIPILKENLKATNGFLESDAATCIIDDDFEPGPLLPIRKQTSAHSSLAFDVNPRISGGLLGPEGCHRNPGSWCKAGQSKIPLATSGSLISVGADGRGGKIKVLKGLDQCMERTQPLHPKRPKLETKQLGVSKGCLQIEHFFRKQ